MASTWSRSPTLFFPSQNPQSPRRKSAGAHPPLAASRSLIAAHHPHRHSDFHPCCSPMFPTTNDHSSFTLITLRVHQTRLHGSGIASVDLPTSSFVLRNCVSTSIRACASPPCEVFKYRNIASFNRSSWSRNSSRSFLRQLQIAHRCQQSLLELRPIFARRRQPQTLPFAIPDPEYLRRNNSASAFDSARLPSKSAPIPAGSTIVAAVLRSARAMPPRSPRVPRFQFWILSKNYFPLPPTLRLATAQQT